MPRIDGAQSSFQCAQADAAATADTLPRIRAPLEGRMNCNEFRSAFAPASSDAAVLEHVRSCDPCLDFAAHVDPDIMFRALGGACDETCSRIVFFFKCNDRGDAGGKRERCAGRHDPRRESAGGPMKRVLMMFLVLLFTTGVVRAEPTEGAKSVSVRTFQFKFKDADRAAAMIKPLLSIDGSMSIQPSANSLVVTDHPDN